jgi:hypothetical protein
MKSDLIVPLGLINEPTPACTTHPPILLISGDNILLNPSSSGQYLSSSLFSLVCMNVSSLSSHFLFSTPIFSSLGVTVPFLFLFSLH